MPDQLTCAKAGGPPDDWFGLRIFDLSTGQEVLDVLEVNTAEGWVVRARRNAAGDVFADEGGQVATERLTGGFVIRLPTQ